MRQVHRAGEKCFVDYSGKRRSQLKVAEQRAEVQTAASCLAERRATQLCGARERSSNPPGPSAR